MDIHFPLWGVPILASALLLGFYDLSIKQSVRNNALFPTVLLTTACGSFSFLVFCLCTGHFMEYAVCTPVDFLLIALKSLLVAASWLCGYYALRELPISLAVPIRATAPLWTFIGAVILYHEIPTLWQGIGMAAVFVGYYAFSVLGKMEGISFRRHKGIHMIALATLLGAASGLYDKYLLGVLQIPRGTVQFWFSVELVIIFAIALLIRRKFFKPGHAFEFRWWIPVTGVLLILSDNLYFLAVGMEGTQISVLSLIRRCGCVVGFTAGILFFHDKNGWGKVLALALTLAGVILLVLA
ncbi:MAG: DMT family transporter [Lentisphaeria bacterium]|nr:DMT family transporter [Lentisphaeria bacterium]